jgi:hypothetical protein
VAIPSILRTASYKIVDDTPNFLYGKNIPLKGKIERKPIHFSKS